nr:MAG TPA: hypothetical protein [Caudoviricetes sp.]
MIYCYAYKPKIYHNIQKLKQYDHTSKRQTSRGVSPHNEERKCP